MIWDLKRPPTDAPIAVPGQMGTKTTEEDDDDVFEDEEEKEEEQKKKSKEEEKAKKAGWGTIKAKSTQILMSAFGGDKKWTPAVGRYWLMRDMLNGLLHICVCNLKICPSLCFPPPGTFTNL